MVIRGRQEGHRLTWEDGSRGRHDARVEGTMCQGTLEASRSWKWQGHGFSPEPPEGAQLCTHPGFSPVTLLTPTLYDNQSLLLKSLSLG